MDPIQIITPATVRQYTTGGKGGTAASSTPIHRLTERHTTGDRGACGFFGTGKIAVTDGLPKPADIEKYGICAKCWPDVPSLKREGSRTIVRLGGTLLGSVSPSDRRWVGGWKVVYADGRDLGDQPRKQDAVTQLVAFATSPLRSQS